MSNIKVFLKYGFGRDNKFVNDPESRIIGHNDNSIVELNSDHFISFRIESCNPEVELYDIKIYCEDFEYLEQSLIRSNNSYETLPINLYRDFLGYSDIRISSSEGYLDFTVNIKMRKISAEKFNAMISYLYNRSDVLLKNLLSASKISFHHDKQQGDETIEIILESANTLIGIIKRNQFKLKNSHKTKLIPQKIESWKINGTLSISPTDVMNNLDSIYGVYGNGDIFIRGRHFKIGGILSDKLIDTPNTIENKIILSGLYSVKRKLSKISNNLLQYQHAETYANDQYVSISDTIIAEFNKNSMIGKINQLINDACELIWFFENAIGVALNGKTYYPVITPVVRISNLYRLIFEELKKWHSFGNPNMNVNKIYEFFNKIKSVPKLFEYFTLFKIQEVLEQNYWICQTNIVDLVISSDVASVDFIHDDNSILQITYEPIISPFLQMKTKHLELVDLNHRDTGKMYNYYSPDFVLKYQFNNEVFYYILDAKFSSINTIRNYRVLEKIVEKYYYNMGIYNGKRNIISRNNILAVVTIYPEYNDYKLNKNNKKIEDDFNSSLPLELPIKMNIPLDIYNYEALNTLLIKLINFASNNRD